MYVQLIDDLKWLNEIYMLIIYIIKIGLLLLNTF